MSDEVRVIDWDAIERDYRAGIKTLREIAGEHEISHVAINKRAKKHEWTRDLSAKIEQKREELVTKASVTSLVTKSDEVTIIKTAAELQAGVILVEREEIKRLGEHADSLEAQLDKSGEDLRTNATVTKQIVEIREKIINMRRRNFGINDNANGEANKPDVSKLAAMSPADAYKAMISA